MNVHIIPGNRHSIANLVEEKVGPGVRVVHAPDGSPLLVGSPLQISVSHSRRFAAIALHPTLRIGIDIEEPRLEQLGRVVEKFLRPDEADLWANRLLAAWTCKEAAFKAAGVPTIGLASISLAEPGIARVPDGRRFALQTIETPDYTLSTALPL